jgi:hypothetical protein
MPDCCIPHGVSHRGGGTLFLRADLSRVRKRSQSGIAALVRGVELALPCHERMFVSQGRGVRVALAGYECTLPRGRAAWHSQLVGTGRQHPVFWQSFPGPHRARRAAGGPTEAL